MLNPNAVLLLSKFWFTNTNNSGWGGPVNCGNVWCWWYYNFYIKHVISSLVRVRRGRDRMVVGFTTSYAISTYSAQARCTHTTLCDTICQWFATGLWFSLGTPVSFTNKTDRHDITEILLKMTLNTISIIINHQVPFWSISIIDKISYLFNIAKIVFLKKWKYWDVVRLQMFIINNFLRHLFFICQDFDVPLYIYCYVYVITL